MKIPLRAYISKTFSVLFTLATDFLMVIFFSFFYVIGFFAGFNTALWPLLFCSFIFFIGIFRKKDSSLFENIHLFALHYGYICFLVGVVWVVLHEGDLPDDSILQFSSFEQLIFRLKSAPISIIHFVLMLYTHLAMFMHLISITKERYATLFQEALNQ